MAQRFAEEGLDGLLRDKTRPPGKLPTQQDAVQAVLERTLTPDTAARAAALQKRRGLRSWTALVTALVDEATKKDT